MQSKLNFWREWKRVSSCWGGPYLILSHFIQSHHITAVRFLFIFVLVHFVLVIYLLTTSIILRICCPIDATQHELHKSAGGLGTPLNKDKRERAANKDEAYRRIRDGIVRWYPDEEEGWAPVGKDPKRSRFKIQILNQNICVGTCQSVLLGIDVHFESMLLVVKSGQLFRELKKTIH